MMSSLDQYFAKPKREAPRSPAVVKSLPWFRPNIPKEMGQSYFVGAGYDGEKRAVYLKLYDPQTEKIGFWYDNKKHTPYCLSKDSIESLEKDKKVVNHPGFLRFERSERYDALNAAKIPVTLIHAADPLSIGGKEDSIREKIRAWEADIRYIENYIYDNHLEPGMVYAIKEGELSASGLTSFPERAEGILPKEDIGYRGLMVQWLRLLESPVPNYRRVALDIEVFSPIETRVPDPETADYPVVAASFCGSDNTRRVLLLRRSGMAEGSSDAVRGIDIEYFDSEYDLLASIFETLFDYPFVFTFNGDDFDLRYLYHRAFKSHLGFLRDQVPIELGRDSAGLKYGIHLDLYRFFFNRSIQVYAFGNKYREVTLDAVADSLLGEGKLETSSSISKLSYNELASYCFRDSELVMELTLFDGEIVMKLINALSRISVLPMEDMSRQGVSGWIKSMMYKEHRERKYLIPRADEIKQAKGETDTTAVIKGKKYKGGMVIEPVPGVHFSVAVLDFASLYPSIIKTWNLGYETILCNHFECKTNRIPDTNHWVCKQRKAMESELIGSLRDIRIKWYKPLSKESTLSPDMASWYQVVQNALKVVLNASYGVFGSDRFALYCPPLAESTAAIGRYAISQTISQAQSLGIEVFYGDTDSIFLGFPGQEKLDELIQWSKKALGMELEVDKTYRYVALSNRKKNYLGVHPDNRVDIKGLTGKKRHIPEFLKSTFGKLIEILGEVKTQADFEEARRRILDLVKSTYGKLQTMGFTLDELAFSIVIGKSIDSYKKTTPQHVTAARLLRGNHTEQGSELSDYTGSTVTSQISRSSQEPEMEVGAGDLVRFVRVRGGKGVKPMSQAKIHEIDIERYKEYFRSTFEQVLDAVGLDYEELTGAKKLTSFFSGA
jgi:DNA polymerase, archaea type